MKNLINKTTILTSFALLSAMSSTVFAHPGHVEAASHGHSHLLALGAVCVAIIVGGVALLRTLKLRNSKNEKS